VVAARRRPLGIMGGYTTVLAPLKRRL